MKSDKQKFWSIGGIKARVGKSAITASMALALARLGKSVVAVDADLDGPNLHTCFGVQNPRLTLLDMLEKRATAEQVVVDTPEPRLRFIGGTAGILRMADPSFVHREQVLRFLASLAAEYIVVDLGAAASTNALDFFNQSDEAVVVVSPDPALMHNAYGFIKSAILRKIERKLGFNNFVTAALQHFREKRTGSRPHTMMDFYDMLCTTDPDAAESVAALVDSYQPLMLVNMASSEQDHRIAEVIQSASKKFLNVDIRVCGLVISDPGLQIAAHGITIPNLGTPECVASRQILQIVTRLLDSPHSRATAEPIEADKPFPAPPIMGLNDNLELMGKELHVQTEDLGCPSRCIATQVFCGGHLVYSARAEYPTGMADDGDRSGLRELMRNQHFNVIRDIESKKVRILHSA